MLLSLKWLEELVAKFPATNGRRRDLISIAGYPSWENVNSNLLAFYLDENEDHGMQRLFLESLLQLISGTDLYKGSEIEFSTDYSISREKDNIDLLIESVEKGEPNSWSIIIENKIHHHLHNNLDKYWRSANGNKKVGVILSLEEIPGTLIKEKGGDKKFVNITHKELVSQVKKNLPEYFDQADDRHLLFLKEYFANIESHYKMETPEPEKERTLINLQHHNEDIKKLNETISSMQYYVQERLAYIFSKYDYEPKNTYLGKDKTYYRKGIEQITGLGSIRFWVDVHRLLMQNDFHIYLELVGDAVPIGKQVKEYVDKEFTKWNERLEKGNNNNHLHYHIASSKKPLSNDEGKSLDEKLDERISLFFEGEERSIMNLTMMKLSSLADIK